MSAIATDIDQFRLETRAWLEENCPASQRAPINSIADVYWGGRNGQFTSEDQKLWFEKMLAKGWVVPHWPLEYGGGGLNNQQNKVLLEEMARLNCRKPLFSFGVSMLGPALLKFANEEQKKHYLTDIVQAKTWWCQGYSEPGAGSDLAGLQTKAEDKGDHYLVSGSKVWTSYADKADWIFCLVRTDFDAPKHKGISFLLIDMASEGVSTAPIKLISGKSPFCETFFDNVKVPKENLIGELGNGWTIAKYLLTHERQMIGGIGDTDANPDLGAIGKEQLATIDGKIADPVLRAQIARLQMEEDGLAYTIERALDEAKAGNNSGAASSLFKYYGTELNMKRYELLLEMAGYDGLEWEGDASNDGRLARMFCRTKGNAIEGGTSEIQLNIIAKRILGLPSR